MFAYISAVRLTFSLTSGLSCMPKANYSPLLSTATFCNVAIQYYIWPKNARKAK